MDSNQFFFPFFLIALPLFVYAANMSNDICSSNTLAVYKIRMDTHWSNETFPKQYPYFRPPAQFSRLLGMVHNTSYILWRKGRLVTFEIRTVAEKGVGELIEQKKGVHDHFAASAVHQGVGSTESIFYADGKHNLISVISKIVPSPDWFVGLDSYELCSNGFWVNNVSINGGPFDAGTDNGFTFTSPNWASDPATPITSITSRQPSHPANSFYYPDHEALPPLVTFHLTKERVYKAINSPKISRRRRIKMTKTNTVVVPLPKVINVASSAIDTSVHKISQPKRSHKKSTRRSGHCVMSTWSSWSPCSASCGVGFEMRTRTVLNQTKRRGSCSKPTQQKRWCGEQSNCIDQFFNW